ncbi:site-specific integrase [Edaphobacter aggregans]|uniref:site-specific integrase n=1 Tax=Edaphobacter aggregans TaxID=570835 RepID=UPI0012FA3836|nr:site-specific integrase [Edaphobacter aggregans]
MTHLRKIMLEELERRDYSARTIRYYVRFVERFAQHFGKSPDKLGLEHVRSYQSYLLTQRRLSPGSVEHHISALRFLGKGRNWRNSCRCRVCTKKNPDITPILSFGRALLKATVQRS